MPQTGDLDSNTLKMMSASRCGNPDNEVGIPPITTFDTNLNQAAVKTPGKFHYNAPPELCGSVKRNQRTQNFPTTIFKGSY